MMNKRGRYLLVFWLAGPLFFLLLESCGNRPSNQAPRDTLSKGYQGELKVDADAGLEPVMGQEKYVFESLHDSVKLDIAYKSEPEMLKDFETKKATVLVLARQLNEKEKEALKDADTIYVREIKVAYDAVALIGNRAFNDSSLDVATLKKYFDPASTAGNRPEMVFANQNSSIVKYVFNFLGYGDKASANVYALKSIDEVIDYVEHNKNAIGFIPFNYLSNIDDIKVKEIYKRIKILSLQAKDENGGQIRVSANQSDIATGAYPLKRTISTITNYSYDDNLEWLFVNFLYREKGAKIFLKDGLIPARMTEREVDVNTNGLNAVNR